MPEDNEAPKRISKLPVFTDEEAAALSDQQKLEAAATTDEAYGTKSDAPAGGDGCWERPWKDRYDECRVFGWSRVPPSG